MSKQKTFFGIIGVIFFLEFSTIFKRSASFQFLNPFTKRRPGESFIFHDPSPSVAQHFVVDNEHITHHLISPKHKLTWCFNYKVASSQITSLFHRLEDDPDWLQLSNLKFQRSEAGCKWLTEKRKAEWRFAYDGKAKCRGMPNSLVALHMLQPLEFYATSVVLNPKFRNVLLVRDPADRLISGVLEKCGKGSKICPVDTHQALHEEPCKTYLEKGDRDAINRYYLAESIKVFNKHYDDYGDDWGNFVDAHFRPQAMFCNIRKGMPFHYIVKYDNTHMGDIMEALFDDLNLPQELLHGWGKSGDKPLFENRDHFMKNLSKHATLRNRSKMDRIRKLMTPEMLADIHKLYKMDYDINPGLNFV